jgi:hypothetical protein
MARSIRGRGCEPHRVTRTQYRRLTPVHMGRSLTRQVAHAPGMPIGQVLRPTNEPSMGASMVAFSMPTRHCSWSFNEISIQAMGSWCDVIAAAR